MSSGYPKFSASSRNGELGVQAVSRIISNEFSWIFRRNSQETDFGIDGHVDVVDDERSVTGQMFALQIKYGISFFQEKSGTGYVYRGEEKHFNYLLNYPVPVLIIICHPENEKCYWTIFDAAETQRTLKNWKITIPFNNDLLFSKLNVKSLLPPLVDGLALMESYWELNNIMMAADHIAYFVDRADVECLEIAPLRNFFDRVSASRDLAHHCMGKVEVAFYGYDRDPRELFEVQEVRNYVALADLAIPELFFFCRAEEPAFTLKLFVTCLLELRFPNGRTPNENNKIRVEFDPKYLQGFLNNHFVGLNKMTEWLGLSNEDNKKICDRVFKIIFPPV